MIIKSSYSYLLIVSFLFLSFSTFGQWVQFGQDIDGEAAGDKSGRSVSMPDTNTVAIGSLHNNGSGTPAGNVRVFTRSGGNWVLVGSKIVGEAMGDQFGYSVSMPDSVTVAVGAPFNDGNGTSSGHVRVYSWNGSAWVQKGSDIDGEAAGDRSGSSVSMPDPNTVAIGATHNNGGWPSSGHVRIYRWNGSAWVQKGSDINGLGLGDNFGNSVSMPDSNTVAIGAPGNDGNGINSGHVRIFSWNGSAWIQKGNDITGNAAYDQSGTFVSMPDANTVTIGSPGNDANGTNAGQVRVFSWTGSAWIQKGNAVSGEAPGDELGLTVSMPDANTFAAGSVYNSGNGTEAGHVRVYSWTGSNWIQVGNDIDGEAAGDRSSSGLSMPDDNFIAIGAFLNNGNGTSSGHVRLFKYCTSYTSSSLSITACNSYTVPSGDETYTTSGTYMDTIPNSAGCDSILTINLTIKTVDTSITNNSPTLIANAANASYQWLDCNKNFSPISGATGQSFTATISGNYAVEVSQNGCVDTSGCHKVTIIGITENDFGETLNVFPNPTSGAVTIDFGRVFNKVVVEVFDMTGKRIAFYRLGTTEKVSFEIPGPSGMYYIKLTAQDRQARMRVLKK